MKSVILLTYFQLLRIGVQLGHEKRQTKFLSTWIFGGWRGRIFLINLSKTIYIFKIALRLVNVSAKYRRPIWFVNLHPYFGGMVARYGYVCGECFNIYWWIGGSVSNFKFVLGWHALLIRLLKTDKYFMRHMDKKKIVGFLGLLSNRRRIPGVGFIPNVKESLTAVDEFMVHKVPNVGILDSNVIASQLMYPIPGNDDSLVCINLYCYLVAQSVLSGKAMAMRKWYNCVQYKPFINRFKKKLMYFYIFEVGFNNRFEILEQYKKFFLQEVEPEILIDITEKIINNSLLTDVFTFTKERINDKLYPNLKVEMLKLE